MRKTLLVAVVSALFLFSCKKEHSPQVKPAQKMYKVTFDMASGFTQTINSLKEGKQQTNALQLDTATSNIAAYASVIQLGIFDGSGNFVRKIQQTAGHVSNFGVIVDSLATGTYTVIAVAGQTGVTLDWNNTIQAGGDVYYTTAARPFSPWGDTFYDKFQLTITNGPVNQTVALTRIVSKVEIDFNDVIPANASRLEVEINQDDFLYLTSNGTPSQPDTVTYHLTIPNSAKGTNTYKVSEIVLNTATPFNVLLTAYDSNNNVIATHTVIDVTCTANQRTILTGNFSNSSTNNNTGTQFNVSVDPSWNSPTIIHY
jgi:hypothetical protein